MSAMFERLLGGIPCRETQGHGSFCASDYLCETCVIRRWAAQELRAAAEREQNFHMGYRMKCDVDTKAAIVRAEAAERSVEAMRKILQQVSERLPHYFDNADGLHILVHDALVKEPMPRIYNTPAGRIEVRDVPARETYPVGWSSNDGPNGQTT